MVNIIVDIVLILVVLAGFILGIKRGFIKTVAKPVKLALAIVIAFSFAAPASEAFIEPTVKEPISNQIEGVLLEKSETLTPENMNEELPTLLKIAATVFNIQIDGVSADADSEEIIAQIVDKLISPAVHIISTAIAFLVLYIVSNIALSILLSILNSVFDTGFVGTVNKILGAVFSTALFVIFAWLLTLLFTYIIHAPALAQQEWVKNFDGGFVYDFFNKFNPIDWLLSF